MPTSKNRKQHKKKSRLRTEKRSQDLTSSLRESTRAGMLNAFIHSIQKEEK